jgi:hypothetical protein
MCMACCILFGYELVDAAIIGRDAEEDSGWIFMCSLVFSAGLIYATRSYVKQFVKPARLINGLVIEKIEEDYDEGYAWFVLVKHGTEEKLEINKKSFDRIRKGDRLEIRWSNKLSQPFRIERIVLQ